MLFRPCSGFKINKFVKILPQIRSSFTTTLIGTSASSDVGLQLLSKQTLSSCTCRQVSTFTALLNNNRSSYEYDPETDTFVPKNPRKQYILNEQRGDSRGKKLKKFLTRYTRNLFLLTGGVVWFGVLCTLVGVIEFASESDFILHLKEEDEEKRILAFYELAKSKDDLESILARDKHCDVEGMIALAKEKEDALNRALVFVREHELVSRYVGTPVQLIGYSAATKLQHLEENHELECKREWKADCLLEGPQGMVSCSFAFEKVMYGEGWVLMNLTVDKMSSSGSPQLELDMPEDGSSIFS